MARRKVQITFPSGSSLHIPSREAHQIVRDGMGQWEDASYRRLKIFNRQFSIRGLSCKIGAILATALRSKTDGAWARTMLAQIRMQRESGSA